MVEPLSVAAMHAPTFSSEGPSVSPGSRAGAVPQSGGATPAGPTRRSLQERRSGGSLALAGLDMDTIASSSRENTAHAAASAHFRGWSPWCTHPSAAAPPLDVIMDPTRQRADGLRVLSYNILAARYTSTDKYVHCPVFALAEAYRLSNIAAEIRGADPDIVVLQECSTHALQTQELGGALQAMGYAWFHVPITNDKKERATSESQGSGNWAPSEQPEHEGVAVVWRSSRFERFEEYPLRFNPLAQRDAALQPEEKKRVMVNSHNVAAIAVLRDCATEATLIVAGIHCFWDTAKPECQLYQTARLLEQVERMQSQYSDLGDTAVFLCGDFNAEVHAPAVQYILQGDAAAVRGHVPRIFNANAAASHGLGLASSYHATPGGGYAERHPQQVSAVGGGFAGVIDYVFHQPAAYRCVAVAKLAPSAEIPNASVPSDHYPVCAWFHPADAA